MVAHFFFESLLLHQSWLRFVVLLCVPSSKLFCVSRWRVILISEFLISLDVMEAVFEQTEAKKAMWSRNLFIGLFAFALWFLGLRIIGCNNVR